MATPEEVDLRQRAERAVRAERFPEALSLYGELLARVETFEAARYDAWLEGELTVLERLGRAREAGFVLLGLRRFGEAQRRLPARERPLEWALAAAHQGRHAEAARVYAEAGRHVLAALELEAAGTFAAARLEWERVLAEPRLVGATYETALVHVALGECLGRAGDRAGGARELGEAQRLLEALADEREGRGDAERALECYVILLRIAKETGSFENVAEATLNSIRLLVAEDRKNYALQYYDDFLSYAVGRGELHAAATLAREAAAYSLKTGLVFERHYLERAADLWAETAARNEAAGGPTDLSENALHAAIEAASELDDGARCVRFYEALAALPLPPAKRERYRRLAARGPGLVTPAPPAPGFPEHLRRVGAYQDVTRDDLVEWELDGDPVAVLARLVVEVGPEDRQSARLALRALLVAWAAQAAPDDARLAGRLALALARVRLYPVLRPLERIFDQAQASAEVRAAVMKGIAGVPLLRTFGLVRAGLADPTPVVFEAALATLQQLGRPAGFEALVAIFRDARDERVRAAALEAIADVGTLDAGVFLVERLREAGPLADAAEARLLTFPDDALLPVVRQAAEVEVGERRAALERVAVALGGLGR
ncbi:MAG TPA: HEAT repeat domain-containing protein [Polyangia bacterium]|nr:HEAT repeat domain-containing protein [Polyangia bacterium]